MPDFDVQAVRRRFPALSEVHGERPLVFLDGPGGTQVPDTVIEAVASYYRTSNANAGGPFATSEQSDAIAAQAHAAMADFLGAADPDEITFGANMTSLTFHVSRSIGATLSPGDEIVVTTLDHQANVDPWLAMANDRGLTVRTVDIRPDDVTLDLDSLDETLGPRTKLVAVGWASNAVGTINPVADIVFRAHAAGAMAYVDAVHFAPHGAMDVHTIDADFLVCSPYKFFGPHAGVLYGKQDVLEALPPYKVRPAHHRYETGTPNLEGMAGVLAAVEYLEWVGRTQGVAQEGTNRRLTLHAAMSAIRAYEMELYGRLVDGIEAIPAVRIHGVTDRAHFDRRVPTLALTIEGVAPRAAAEALGRDGIATWDGDFYATGLIERLGLAESGGLLRIGLVHYNTADEVDRLLESLERIASGAVAHVS
ncbi:MAG TPA: cysteine desulfurase-like protein [Candidatus Limnocylindrales bacterium]|nr:cysteine desulfurase-like protein [Candidatus Limnocylindrales bacterium]